MTKATPPAMATGSGTAISPEIQAGCSAGLPPWPATTLKAMMLPDFTGPCAWGNCAAEVGSPQVGTYNQVCPSESFHTLITPQMPLPSKVCRRLV